MTRLECGAAAAVLMMSLPLSALAQDDAPQPLYELRPGTVVVLVPETGLTYQLPVTLAVEVCPDIDEAYLVSDFEGTTEVVCEVPEAVAAGYDFESQDGDDDEPVAEAADPAPTDGEVEDGGAAAPDDGTVEDGTDADAGTDGDTGVDGGSGDDAGADAGGDVDAGTDDAGADADAGGGADAGDGDADATGG